VRWKGWLEGHQFDLEALGDLFSAGDPLVARDTSCDYYVESAALQDSDGKIDVNAAQVLIKRMNGAARAANSSFQPVSLSGRYNGPDGSATVVGSAALVMGRMKFQATAVVTDGNGNVVSTSPPAPIGPRYLKLANHDPDVADALRALGQPDPLDWYDIYKVWEIVEHAVGGSGQVQRMGWASKADINRLTASANHPGISGDEARHARYKGSPGANLSMTMSEAESLVRRLVAKWIESHPSY
jgi:hypothetical protein